MVIFDPAVAPNGPGLGTFTDATSHYPTPAPQRNANNPASWRRSK